jgi:hypothetical protein
MVRRGPPSAGACARRALCGFTLAEMLIAATLGALLLVGTASSAGMFGTQVQALKDEVDDSKERALSSIAQDIRYGWSAETPSTRELRIFDSAGRLTIYKVIQGEIQVTRPDGSTGTLVDNLVSASFASETATRYREDTPLSRGSTVWSASAPTGAVDKATLLEPGEKLALGFTLGSNATFGYSLATGVQEQLLTATLETLSLDIGSIFAKSGTLYVDLFRARSPDDARPVGSSLGQVSFNAKGFAKAKAYVWDTKKLKEMPIPKGKAWGWWKLNGDYELIVKPPTKSTKLDIAAFNAKVQPGYAYTLVLQVAGDAGIALRSYTIAQADGSGVATAPSSGAWSESALALTRSMEGISTVTQASAKSVVERVRISLTGKDNDIVSGYASLSSQNMIPESWLGSVTGEVAP